jgi:hypothetical protein
MLPGLVMAAAASGGFFVLLIAAGIVRRGGWVALSAVAGAISQTVATAILLPAIGLQGVGIGAVFAQVMSLFMLAGAVRHSVLNVGRSVLLLLIGGIVAVAVQPLNTKPADTLAVRVALAVGCALWAGLAAWRMTPLSAAPWRHRA